MTEVARYGTKDPDTCTSGGEGDGKLDISIPTSAGVQTFSAVFTFIHSASCGYSFSNCCCLSKAI